MEREQPKYRLAAVPASADPAPSDEDQTNPLSTLVPEGDYALAFVKEELASNFGREVYFVTMQFEEGEYKGKRVLRFYSKPRTGAHLARSSSLSQDFMAMTGLSPHRRDSARQSFFAAFGSARTLSR